MYVLLLSALAYVIYQSSKKKIAKEETPIERLIETFSKYKQSFSNGLKRINNEIKMSRDYSGGKPKPMTKDEALMVLDLQKGATKDEVNQAFRKLMMTNHPDKGGSKYLASKVIEAREVLLDDGSKKNSSEPDKDKY